MDIAYLSIGAYRIVVGALMFGPIRTVAERFRAAIVLAAVRSFAGVRSLVDFQILQTRERLVAAAKLHENGWKFRATVSTYIQSERCNRDADRCPHRRVISRVPYK